VEVKRRQVKRFVTGSAQKERTRWHCSTRRDKMHRLAKLLVNHNTPYFLSVSETKGFRTIEVTVLKRKGLREAEASGEKVHSKNQRESRSIANG
jgi:hypothetical protein